MQTGKSIAWSIVETLAIRWYGKRLGRLTGRWVKLKIRAQEVKGLDRKLSLIEKVNKGKKEKRKRSLLKGRLTEEKLKRNDWELSLVRVFAVRLK